MDEILTLYSQLTILKLTMVRLTVNNNNELTSNKAFNIKCIELNRVHFNIKSINTLSKLCPKFNELKLIRYIKDKEELEQRIYIHLPTESLQTLIIDKIYLGLNRLIERSSVDVALFAIDIIKQECIRLFIVVTSIKPIKLQSIKSSSIISNEWDNLEEILIPSSYRQLYNCEKDILYGHLYIQCKSTITHFFYNEVSV